MTSDQKVVPRFSAQWSLDFQNSDVPQNFTRHLHPLRSGLRKDFLLDSDNVSVYMDYSKKAVLVRCVWRGIPLCLSLPHTHKSLVLSHTHTHSLSLPPSLCFALFLARARCLARRPTLSLRERNLTGGAREPRVHAGVDISAEFRGKYRSPW